jgi:N-acetylglucosaminylphosphatidylinositol deacetylase
MKRRTFKFETGATDHQRKKKKGGHGHLQHAPSITILSSSRHHVLLDPVESSTYSAPIVCSMMRAEDSNSVSRRQRPNERCEGEHRERRRGRRRRLRVFVIAHPDDESMFFVPTIHHFILQRQHQQQQKSVDFSGADVWLICLTSGNYNGLGTLRAKELRRTCKDILGIDKVIVMTERKKEDSIFFDHPRQSWDVKKAAQCLLQTMHEALHQEHSQQQQQALRVIDFITFDELGVSGHVNHRDTYRTVKCLCEKLQQQQQHFRNVNDFPRCIAWTLETEQNIVSKYLPIYSWILLLLSTFCSFVFKSDPDSGQDDDDDDDDTDDEDDDTDSDRRRVYRLHQPWINWNAMRSHASQFVWYRRLFVIFSSYTYVNVLRRMDIITHPQQQQQIQQHQNEKQKSQ